MDAAMAGPAFDPYKTLQLHPNASLELITEAYWVLASRAQRERARSSVRSNEGRIRDLNAAYEILANSERRGDHDLEQGLLDVPGHVPDGLARRSRGGQGNGPRHKADFYELLSVDREASAEVIELSATLLLARSAQTPDALRYRDRVADAGRTLCDPALRNAYDASLGPERHHREAPQQKDAVDLHQDGEPDIARPLRRLLAVAASRAQRLAARAGGNPVRSTPKETSDLPAPAAASDSGVRAGANGTAATPPRGVVAPRVNGRPDAGDPALIASVDQPTSAAPAAVRRWLRAKPAAATPATEDERRSEEPVAVPPPPVAPEHARLLELKERAREAVDVTLRERAEPMLAAAPADAGEPRPPAAELLFVGGQLAGTRFSVGEETITLGSDARTANIVLADDDGAVAGEHARIWRHGQQFMFHELQGKRTRIDGEALALPLVILDDGDEIVIGSHRIKFRVKAASHALPV